MLCPFFFCASYRLPPVLCFLGGAEEPLRTGRGCSAAPLLRTARRGEGKAIRSTREEESVSYSMRRRIVQTISSP